MKRIISISFLVIALAALFIACNKSDKTISRKDPPLVFKSDAERDANAATLAKMISEDKDWQALKQINYEFLDIVVKSNVPITNDLLTAGHPALQQLNSKAFQVKFKEAKKLAAQLNNKYFQNSKQCYSCESMTDAKWKTFAKKVDNFRNNKVDYDRFLTKLGVGPKNNMSLTVVQDPYTPDCNNWRFTLCGGACVVTAPTVVIFAACMAMCVAEFC